MNLRVPVVRGVIARRLLARRLLVNFRVKPEIIGRLLPPPFRPKLVRDWAMAGICLIRLERLRPSFLPAALGCASENAAHRIAVEWDEGGARREGVFIQRHDSDSLLNQLAGGRLFPGVHHAALFRAWHSDNRFKVEVRRPGGELFVRVAAQVVDAWPAGSVFQSLSEASAFFEAGSCGWSPNSSEHRFDGVELRTQNWHAESLLVERVESAFFQNPPVFPRNSVEFDCALLMRGIQHEWHSLGTMCAANKGRRASRRRLCTFFEMP